MSVAKRKKDADDEFAFDEVLGVWFDLERALEGTNGFGGDVAEIYAYRLVPKRHRDSYETDRGVVPAEDPWPKEKQAEVAGKNLTRLAKHFVELHEGVEISIEEHSEASGWIFRVIDPREEPFPPFDHRVHLRVSKTARNQKKLYADLLALWNFAHDEGVQMPAQWRAATEELLLAMGMKWDEEAKTFVLPKVTTRGGSREE